MPTTYRTYTGDGVTTDFLFDVPYIKEADVHGYVDSVEGSISFVDPTHIRFAVAPADTTTVDVRRLSDASVARFTFPDPTYLKTANLDGNNEHLRYLIEEQQDISGLAPAAEAAASAEAAADSAVDADNSAIAAAASVASIIHLIATDKAAAVLLTPIAGQILYILSADGRGSNWRAVTPAAPGTYSNDSSTHCGTVIIPTSGDGSSAFIRDYKGARRAAWYGALNDGSNIGVAVQAAIDAMTNTISTNNNVPAPRTGGELLFGDGDWYLNTDILTRSDNITLGGTGTGCRILLDGTASLTIGVWTGDKLTSTNVKMFNLENITVASKTTYTGAIMLDYQRAAHVGFKNAYIQNNVVNGLTTPVTCVKLQGVQWLSANNLLVEGATKYALQIESLVNDEGHYTFVGGGLYIGKEPAIDAASLYANKSGAGAPLTHVNFYGSHLASFPSGGSSDTYAVYANNYVFDNLGLNDVLIEQPTYGIKSDTDNKINLNTCEFYGNSVTITAILADGGASTYSVHDTNFYDLTNGFMATGLRTISNLKFSSVTTLLANVSTNLSYAGDRPLGSGNGFLKKSGTETLPGTPTNPVVIPLSGMYQAPSVLHLSPDYNTSVTVNSITQTAIDVTLGTLSAGRKIHWSAKCQD